MNTTIRYIIVLRPFHDRQIFIIDFNKARQRTDGRNRVIDLPGMNTSYPQSYLRKWKLNNISSNLDLKKFLLLNDPVGLCIRIARSLIRLEKVQTVEEVEYFMLIWDHIHLTIFPLLFFNFFVRYTMINELLYVRRL